MRATVPEQDFGEEQVGSRNIADILSREFLQEIFAKVIGKRNAGVIVPAMYLFIRTLKLRQSFIENVDI